MKTKARVRKNPLNRESRRAAASETKLTEAQAASKAVGPVITELAAAPPETLLEYAREEPDRKALSEYVQVIVELRRKGFAFREIAEWLRRHGVEADHNAVYRIYTKGLSEYEVHQLDQEIQEEER